MSGQLRCSRPARQQIVVAGECELVARLGQGLRVSCGDMPEIEIFGCRSTSRWGFQRAADGCDSASSRGLCAAGSEDCAAEALRRG